jgi:hypothetical protein
VVRAGLGLTGARGAGELGGWVRGRVRVRRGWSRSSPRPCMCAPAGRGRTRGPCASVGAGASWLVAQFPAPLCVRPCGARDSSGGWVRRWVRVPCAVSNWRWFDPRHSRGILLRPIGAPSAPYGRLAGLLGRVPMLRASRREDRKRVPQYSSLQLPPGSAGADVRESSGKRQRGTGQAPGGPLAPARGSGRARTSQSRDVRTRDIHVSGSATRPTAWVGEAGRGAQAPRVPERYERQDY